jgi:hypothetical protein
MADQPLDLSCSQPLDLTTKKTFVRNENPFPTIHDFDQGGQFDHLNIPFFPPAPIQLLKYLYGDDVIHHDLINQKDQYRILRHIHEEVLGTGLYCSCGMHLLQGPPEDSRHVKLHVA